MVANNIIRSVEDICYLLKLRLWCQLYRNGFDYNLENRIFKHTLYLL